MYTINNRRSVRKFNDKPVSDEKIMEIVKAGMQAPSAGNQQPWEFIIVRDEETRKKLSKISPYASAAHAASVCVVVVGNTDGLIFYPCMEYDLSACVENMLLKSVDLGLGSTWLAISPVEARIEAVNEIFDLPQNIVPFAIVPIGYSDQENKAEERFEDYKIHIEKY